MSTLTRGQVARACGVGAETIRFYERQGLLPSAQRGPNGYRRYGEATVARLSFIRRAKNLGFDLGEISELLALHDDPHNDRAAVKALTEHKLDEIRAKIRDLQRIRRVLATLADECSGTGPVSGCPIVQALASPGAGQPDAPRGRRSG